MKRMCFACTVTENGKYYSFVEVIRTEENILDHIKRHKGMIEAIVCGTRRDADNMVIERNEKWKADDCYMFSEPF